MYAGSGINAHGGFSSSDFYSEVCPDFVLFLKILVAVWDDEHFSAKIFLNCEMGSRTAGVEWTGARIWN